MLNQLPKRNDSLENPDGFPKGVECPLIQDKGKFKNVLYKPSQIITDWEGYKEHIKRTKPDFKPRVLLLGHDMSEIENITLMSLGGVVKHMNGEPEYLLLGPENINLAYDVIERVQPDWFGISLYTGLTTYVFDWLKQYKIDKARSITKKHISNYETADRLLKGMVQESKGPVYEGNKIVYAPIIIGGHYNNYDYKESWSRGGDYVIRGKGINLLRDILLGAYEPGIYHDPLPYANIPRMDREKFYKDTFEFSDKTKKYALSRIKSVLTALGCSYSCTYCYIGSIVENLRDAYSGTEITPPSILQDRRVDVVVQEGKDILELDEKYGVRTTAVFDQADISLNNMEWWRDLSDKWVKEVGIPFYIQARPGMLAKSKGRERIDMIARNRLVAGISMAVESGDHNVRRLLLKRYENDEIILDAIANVKEKNIPLRTQSIVGLPVLRPERVINPSESTLSLIDTEGQEYYYDDPIQETLKCLELVCRSEFGKEDYFWNALYSPFPGTPLGDYTIAAGFSEDDTDDRVYQFISDSGLKCFTGITVKRQIAYSLTSNFFSHFRNGKDMMVLYLYGNNRFDLEGFAELIHDKSEFFKVNDRPTRFGIIPNITQEILIKFIDHAYGEDDNDFKLINTKLVNYYMALIDGLVLAAKVAVKYFELKKELKEFTAVDLYKVERVHYYDNHYNMAYIPEMYHEFFRFLVHDNRFYSNTHSNLRI